MGVLDVFNQEAFNVMSLTASVERLPSQPGRIGKMGLFTPKPISTTTVMIEERDGLLALLPTVQRGGPATQLGRRKRTARSLTVPHIPLEDEVLAEDIQNVRAWGSEDRQEAIASVVNDHLQTMKQSHEVTWEYLKIGALQGNILDADGTSVIYNLFTEFGKTEIAIDFKFTVSTTDIRAVCLSVKRAMEDAVGGGVAYNHIHAFCGSDWFDDLIGHADVKTAYERWKDGEMFRNDPRAGFPFADIIFEEYRGSIGTVDFFPSDEARFFPVGIPNMFLVAQAPADFIESVNTMGKAIYAKQAIDPEFQRWVKIHTQSNPLPFCVRPEVLIKGTQS